MFMFMCIQCLIACILSFFVFLLRFLGCDACILCGVRSSRERSWKGRLKFFWFASINSDSSLNSKIQIYQPTSHPPTPHTSSHSALFCSAFIAFLFISRTFFHYFIILCVLDTIIYCYSCCSCCSIPAQHLSTDLYEHRHNEEEKWLHDRNGKEIWCINVVVVVVIVPVYEFHVCY